jgi:hypothetical protein
MDIKLTVVEFCASRLAVQAQFFFRLSHQHDLKENWFLLFSN